MFATLKKTLVAGAVLAVTAASAQAALTVKFDQPNMGFGIGPIVVESTDGKTWSKINSTKLTLPIAMFVGHNSNDYAMKFLMVQQGKKIIYDAPLLKGGFDNPTSIQKVVDGSTNNFDSSAKMNLRDACNKRLVNPGAINEDQKLFFKVPLRLVAKFKPDNGTFFAKTALGHSMVPVVCKGFPKRVPPKPKSPQIQLFKFQAYAETGKSCPRYRTVRLRLEGINGGTADVVVMRDDGKKIERAVPITKPGNHQFFVLESTRVKKSETRKYYLIVKGTKISVGWKTVAIKCSVAENDRPGTVSAKPETTNGKPKPGTIVTGKKPTRPVIVVRPVKPNKPQRLTSSKLRCIGGKVKLNTCYCPHTQKRLKLAKNTYRCVKMVTNKTPKRVKPNSKRRVAAPHKKTQPNGPVFQLFKTVR